jgi:hypothetical protein
MGQSILFDKDEFLYLGGWLADNINCDRTLVGQWGALQTFLQEDANLNPSCDEKLAFYR